MFRTYPICSRILNSCGQINDSKLVEACPIKRKRKERKTKKKCGMTLLNFLKLMIKNRKIPTPIKKAIISCSWNCGYTV